MSSKNINELIAIFREEGAFYNTPSFFIGTIKQGFPNLQVNFNNITLDKNDLRINPSMVKLNNTTTDLKDALVEGDKVVMVKDGDIFIIISKVVSI